MVNGFARVRDQQACDVIKLTAHVAQLQHGQDLLVRRIAELRAKPVMSGEPSFSDAFDDIFKDIFGPKT